MKNNKVIICIKLQLISSKKEVGERERERERERKNKWHMTYKTKIEYQNNEQRPFA